MSQFQCFEHFTPFYYQYYQSINNNTFTTSITNCIDLCESSQLCNGINYNYDNYVCVILNDEYFYPNLIGYNRETYIAFYMRSFSFCSSESLLPYPYFLAIIMALVLSIPLIYFVCCRTNINRERVRFTLSNNNQAGVPPPYEEFDNADEETNNEDLANTSPSHNDSLLQEDYEFRHIEVTSSLNNERQIHEEYNLERTTQSLPIPIPERRVDNI